MADRRRRGALRLAVGVAVGLLFLVLIARRLEWGAVADTLRSADVRLLPAIVALLSVHYALKGLRWRALLRAREPVSAALAIRLTMVGFLMNNVFPARIGEMGRPWLLSANHPRVPFPLALATVVGDKLFDLAAVVVCLAIASLTLPLPDDVARGLGLLALVCGAGLAAVIAAAAGRRWLDADARPDSPWVRLARRGGRVGERVRTALLHFADGLATASSPRAAGEAALWTVLSFALLALSAQLTMRMLHIDGGAAAAVLFMGLIGVGFLLPAPPTAAGTFHWFAAQAPLLLGLADADAAFSFALVAHASQVAVVTAFGVAALPGLGWRRLRELGAGGDRG